MAATATFGQDETQASEAQRNHSMAARGRETFRSFCGSCHGPDALGNGKIAQYLTVTPADLTRIRERNGGDFPYELIYEVIDGRVVVRGHGTREMPLWGDVFQEKLASDAGSAEEEPEARASRKIDELVAYLESIQQPDNESEGR